MNNNRLTKKVFDCKRIGKTKRGSPLKTSLQRIEEIGAKRANHYKKWRVWLGTGK